MTDEKETNHAFARSLSNAGLVRIPCCDHKPSAIHVYGTYEIAGKPRDFPMNEVELCDSCGAELWARIKDSVAAQYMHYEIMPMPNAKGKPTIVALGGLCDLRTNEQRGNGSA